jgi:hypothetical protein
MKSFGKMKIYDRKIFLSLLPLKLNFPGEKQPSLSKKSARRQRAMGLCPMTPQGGIASLTSFETETRGEAAGLCLRRTFFSQNAANFGSILTIFLF